MSASQATNLKCFGWRRNAFAVAPVPMQRSTTVPPCSQNLVKMCDIRDIGFCFRRSNGLLPEFVGGRSGSKTYSWKNTLGLYLWRWRYSKSNVIRCGHVIVHGLRDVFAVDAQAPEVHGLLRYFDVMEALSERVLMVVPLIPFTYEIPTLVSKALLLLFMLLTAFILEKDGVLAVPDILIPFGKLHASAKHMKMNTVLENITAQLHYGSNIRLSEFSYSATRRMRSWRSMWGGLVSPK